MSYLVLITAPTQEPLSIAEAKAHLRVDGSDEDGLITALITVAREAAEARCRRSLMPQTLKLTLSAFPWSGCRITGFIDLPRPSFLSLESVQYIDSNGTLITMTPAATTVSEGQFSARLRAAFGTVWPETRVCEDAVTITYSAGYADAASVPASIKAWMKIFIATLYDNRDAIVRGAAATSTFMPRGFVDGLLDPYTVPAVA